MLKQYISQEEYEKATIEAKGPDAKEFSEKKTWLENRWQNQDDSIETRLVSIMLKYPTPLETAIIADNLTYFEKHYKEKKDDLDRILARACLCGAQNVAEFLLKELHEDYLSNNPEYDYILSYVSASNNTEWVKKIATIMAKAGKDMPDSIYRLSANDEICDSITEIFKNNKPKANTATPNKKAPETKKNSPPK